MAITPGATPGVDPPTLPLPPHPPYHACCTQALPTTLPTYQTSTFLTSRDLPPYDGSLGSPCWDWLEQMAHLIANSAPLEPAIVGYLPQLLRGAAREWFHSLTFLNRAALKNWPDWFQAIRAVFGDINVIRQQARERCWLVDEGEDSDVFFFAMIKLLRRCDPDVTESYCLLRIIERVPQPAQFMLDGITTLTDLRVKLRQVKKTAPELAQRGTEEEDKACASSDEGSTSFETSTSGPSEPNDSPSPPPRRRGISRRMTRTCRFCNDWHFDADCPYRR